MKEMRKNCGFTLLELVIVIAIIAVLSAVAIPSFSGSLKSAVALDVPSTLKIKRRRYRRLRLLLSSFRVLLQNLFFMQQLAVLWARMESLFRWIIPASANT